MITQLSLMILIIAIEFIIYGAYFFFSKTFSFMVTFIKKNQSGAYPARFLPIFSLINSIL